MTGDMIWVDVKPGLWRSVDGRYAILRTVLPEDRPYPTEVYTLRKLHSPATVAPYPGSLGHFVDERYSLDGAMKAAANDAYADDHADEREIPEDFPAVATERFFWPISSGVTRGALVVVREGDRVLARVVGMSRGEHKFEPGIYAEVDITDLKES